MKKYILIILITCTLLLTESCSKNEYEPIDTENTKTSLRIKNATGKNFLELIPPMVVSEPNYGNIQDFYYTIKVGDFGFRLDTLANDSVSYYLNDFTEASATQLFTRCIFTYTIYQSGSAHYTMTKDIKDTITLAEKITCILGKKYTLILNDLEGDADLVESE